MARDLRDPAKLGAVLAELRRTSDDMMLTMDEKRPPLSVLYDTAKARLDDVVQYDATHMGPIEKYGDPTKLPPTQ